MKERRKYRIFVCTLLLISILGLGIASLVMLRSQIPDHLLVKEEGEAPGLFDYPYNQLITETVSARETIEYRLFGKIPIKTVSASVVKPVSVYAGGMPVGIYLRTKGVMVIGTGDIAERDGSSCCPAANIVRGGDYITAVNGTKMNTKEELVSCISQCSGQELILTITRDSEQIKQKVVPVMDEQGMYRAGIWVRNDSQGIGTLTYIDAEGRFGALGHGISDVDTGKLLDIEGGVLYDAEVVSVIKGRQGTPGELAGIIRYNERCKMGIIEENQTKGVYGTVTGFPLLKDRLRSLEVAYRQDIELGAAAILCTMGGENREFAVQIKEIHCDNREINKGIVLEVTDPELLAQTGGIIQGMSGSPIIQNGKLIGAVTHVFVNDPTKGYGIFAETMLEPS